MFRSDHSFAAASEVISKFQSVADSTNPLIIKLANESFKKHLRMFA